MVASRNPRARIARLRERIEQEGWRNHSARPVLDILKGILDLLDDELGYEEAPPGSHLG